MQYRSKTDLVADAIRDRIRAGELRSGDVLRQRDLAAELGVSPTPVREALRTLEAGGYVTVEPHRGATVVRTPVSRLEENSRIRGALEPLAVQMAAEQATEEDMAEIRRLRDEFAASEPEDPRRRSELNRMLHMRIYEAARSPILLSLLRMLWHSLDDGPDLYRSHVESVRQHSLIVKSLCRRDGDAAAALTHEHIIGAIAEMRLHLAHQRDTAATDGIDDAHSSPM